MRAAQIRSTVILTVVLSLAILEYPSLTVHAAGPLSGSFTTNPQFILAGGNNSFTGTGSGGILPYTFSWDFGDGSPKATGNFTTHIYKLAGSYTVTMNVTDSTPTTAQAPPQVVLVQGSPLNIDGWRVNWNITTFHGIEISNVTYNGVKTIIDAKITGILVRYAQPPPGLPQCIFFDDLGADDVSSSIGGLSLQYSTTPTWFQIRVAFNPSTVGYNYTQFWRFYQSGEWEAEFAIGHIGCGWNHIYEPHYRFILAPGSQNRNLMGQYTPSGMWQNMAWEGNYTDNSMRDALHNSTEWRIGDGHSYYYMRPQVWPWATEMPRLGSHIILLRDHPGEIEPTTEYDTVDSLVNPSMFVNGELAYRQGLAFYYVPKLWDHWLGLGSPTPSTPSIVMLSFFPNGI